MKRAKLFTWLKYQKITDQVCNGNYIESTCENCSVQKECDYLTEHLEPFLITLKNLPSFWFDNISEKISRLYYKHKKTHYECCVCHRIEAPYFEDYEWGSMTHDFGWHKFKHYKYTRWICHHCADHGYSKGADKNIPLHDRDYTWDEWQNETMAWNQKLLRIIKNKDGKYYNKMKEWKYLLEDNDE